MLRRDVVEACGAGHFHIYAVGHIDEGMALLTRRVAGMRGAKGTFPASSVNRLVENRLAQFAEMRRKFSGGAAP